MGHLMQRAARGSATVPLIPNSYRPGDPVPYMPGSGEPLIGREEIEGRMHLVGVPVRK